MGTCELGFGTKRPPAHSRYQEDLFPQTDIGVGVTRKPLMNNK